MSDNVNKPNHYTSGGVECIDGIRAALGDGFSDYCLGNVLKYVWRCRHKGDLLEDLRKAAKYLEWAIAEAESEKPSDPQELAIPDGWRELEENEPLSEGDLFDFEGEWVGHECDPSGGVYSSRIHRRHIRKIETEKPEHVEGVWVEEADANAKKIKPTETSDASIPDPGPGYRLLSKDPPEPVVKGDEFWQGFNSKWVESENFMEEGCHQFHAFHYRRKIEPAETSDASLPDPGEGYRLLSKDPPEDLLDTDEGFFANGRDGWHWLSVNYSGGDQLPFVYYRRKIEPTEWIPKVGDKVRVVRGFMNPVGEIGFVKEFCAAIKGNFTISTNGGTCTLGWFKKDDVELIEAAQ